MNDRTKSVLLRDNPDLRRYLFTENPAPGPSHPAPWLEFSVATMPKDGVYPPLRFSQNFQKIDFVYLDQILDTLALEQDPNASVDSTLSREAKHNFWHYWKTKPLPYAGMFAKKTWHMWRAGPRDTMKLLGWRVFHLAVVLFAFAGLVVLAVRRRWEALVLGALIIGITAEGTLLLAAERRVLVLVPIVGALAGAGAVWAFGWVSARFRNRPAATA
jgi:hypothetical protein